MKIRSRQTFDAFAWFRNGDHPHDESVLVRPNLRTEGKIVRYYRHPDVSGETICAECGVAMHEHGWLDASAEGKRATVCPGDFVVSDGHQYWAMSVSEMATQYERAG